MRAVVYRRYGPPDVLEFQEVDDPLLTEDGVLVRVHAASVNPYDWHFLRGEPRMLRLTAGPFRPKRRILGLDVAGRVEAVGPSVTRFQPGDEVFGICPQAFAERVCMPESSVVPKPTNLDFEESAAVPVAGLTALQGLRDKGRIESGHEVLINGASGGVGTFAVQIARSFGADVTGVCSTRNLELVQSIGAGHVIDYIKEDYTRSGRRYDLVLDAVGNHSLKDSRRSLAPGGVFVAAAGTLGRLLWLGVAGGRSMVGMITEPNRQDLVFLKEMLESGEVAPVIDRRYPLRETAAAIRYVEEGHARGKVVLTV